MSVNTIATSSARVPRDRSCWEKNLGSPNILQNAGLSVEIDWLGFLPPVQLNAFRKHSKESESCYFVFSIELNEAMTLRDEGSRTESLHVARLASDLCGRLTENLDNVCGAMAEHCKEHGTAPSLAALDPECFCCRRVRRWALRDRALHRLPLSRNSRFLRKLSTLSQIVAVSCADFRRATIDLTVAQGADSAGRLWAVMDAAEYDLNTSLRELLVMLKCFLRVLSADDLALFERTLLSIKTARRESASLTDWVFLPLG
jgi:hypothetical protein